MTYRRNRLFWRSTSSKSNASGTRTSLFLLTSSKIRWKVSWIRMVIIRWPKSTRPWAPILIILLGWTSARLRLLFCPLLAPGKNLGINCHRNHLASNLVKPTYRSKRTSKGSPLWSRLSKGGFLGTFLILSIRGWRRLIALVLFRNTLITKKYGIKPMRGGGARVSWTDLSKRRHKIWVPSGKIAIKEENYLLLRICSGIELKRRPLSLHPCRNQSWRGWSAKVEKQFLYFKRWEWYSKF